MIGGDIQIGRRHGTEVLVVNRRIGSDTIILYIKRDDSPPDFNLPYLEQVLLQPLNLGLRVASSGCNKIDHSTRLRNATNKRKLDPASDAYPSIAFRSIGIRNYKQRKQWRPTQTNDIIAVTTIMRNSSTGHGHVRSSPYSITVRRYLEASDHKFQTLFSLSSTVVHTLYSQNHLSPRRVPVIRHTVQTTEMQANATILTQRKLLTTALTGFLGRVKRRGLSPPLATQTASVT